MSGKAIEATQHIRIEEDAAAGLPALTAVEALDAYEAKFVTAAGTTQARSDFLAAAQTNGETLTQWHTRIGTLYRRAHPNAEIETNHELIEKFCLGLWNSTLAERTLTDQPATMTAALNNASRHLATKVTMARRLDGGTRQRSLNAIKEPKGSDNKRDVDAAAATKKLAAIRCFFCKKLGHPKKDCFAFKRSQANKQGGDKSRSTKGNRFSRREGQAEQPSLNALAAYLDAALRREEEESKGERDSQEDNTASGN